MVSKLKILKICFLFIIDLFYSFLLVKFLFCFCFCFLMTNFLLCFYLLVLLFVSEFFISIHSFVLSQYSSQLFELNQPTNEHLLPTNPSFVWLGVYTNKETCESSSIYMIRSYLLDVCLSQRNQQTIEYFRYFCSENGLIRMQYKDNQCLQVKDNGNEMLMASNKCFSGVKLLSPPSVSPSKSVYSNSVSSESLSCQGSKDIYQMIPSYWIVEIYSFQSKCSFVSTILSFPTFQCIDRINPIEQTHFSISYLLSKQDVSLFSSNCSLHDTISYSYESTCDVKELVGYDDDGYNITSNNNNFNYGSKKQPSLLSLFYTSPKEKQTSFSSSSSLTDSSSFSSSDSSHQMYINQFLFTKSMLSKDLEKTNMIFSDDSSDDNK